MGPKAVMEPTISEANRRYPLLRVNGESVQVCKDMVLEFTDDNDRLIQAVVAPTPAGDRVPTGFFRESGGNKEVYDIVQVLMLRINGERSKQAVAIGYSDTPRKLVFLFPAVDVLRDARGHEKHRESVMLYRAVEPSTGKTVKSLAITTAKVTNLEEVDLAE